MKLDAPLKRLADLRVSNVDKKSTEGEEPVRLCNYVDVYYNDRITDRLPFMEATATVEQIRDFSLKAGDVLFTKDSETADDIAVPAFVDEDLPGVVCGYHLTLARPNATVDGRYLYWALASQLGREQFAIAATGVTRYGLRYEEMGGVRLPAPPLSIQRAIADFLDRETARIDALIAAKRRMIELLEEQDVALAHSAITGVPIAGDRRPSGLPWLGQLPDEWKLSPVTSQFEVALGRMLNAERAAGGDMRPYVRNINVRWDRVDVGDVAVMDFPAAERPKYLLRYGDLLINEGGAGVGRAAIWRGEISECYFQKSVLRLRPRGHTSVEWMVECMRVAVAQRVPLVEGNLATIPHLPAEALRVWRLPFPPAETQRQLLQWLKVRRQRSQAMRSVSQRQVDLLNERRRALITAAVTGEIRIEGAAG